MQYTLLSLLAFSLLTITNIIAQSPDESNALMFRNNPQLTGVYTTPPVYKVQEIKFRFRAEGPIRSTPAIANGIIYVGGGDNNFYAVGANSGKELWRFKTGGAVHSSPAINKGIVYFNSRDNYLYALKVSSGRLLWKFKMGKDLGIENYWDHYLSSPIIIKNTLLVGSGDGNLYSFDINTKKILWKYNSGARIRSTPSVYEDNVIFGNNDGFIFNLNRITGKVKWKFATDGVSNTFESRNNDRKSIYCSAAIEDGIVVTGGRDGIVYAIDLLTGKEKWRNEHKGPWILSTAIKDGVAFVGSGSDFIVQALNLKTGIEKWRFKAGGAIFSSITIAGDMLYFNDTEPRGSLHALDIETGEEKWKFPMGSRSFSTPVIVNGVVYNATENGMLYALKGSTISPSPLLAKKIVYWQGKKNSKEFSYFQNGIDEYLKNYFVSAGYQLVNAKQLEELMEEQLEKKIRSVIVFADNRFPENITIPKTGKRLIRSYLDAGGKVVLLGANPLSYVTDTSGAINYNDSLPELVFDIKYAEKKNIRGIYEFQPTTEGRKLGLYSYYNGISNFTVINPHTSIIPLVKDEFGSITGWLKNYGGPTGSGYLQFWIPQNEASPVLAEMRTIIEYGITW